MAAEQLKKRMQSFGISIINLVQTLPTQSPIHIISQQLIRCSTSVGANFRAACRARSRADFIAKLKIVEEECDESIYWLELLMSADKRYFSIAKPHIDEANQLLSITVASIKTARSNS
jgi:four helix bundle protein